jgi:hypothetical protein
VKADFDVREGLLWNSRTDGRKEERVMGSARDGRRVLTPCFLTVAMPCRMEGIWVYDNEVVDNDPVHLLLAAVLYAFIVVFWASDSMVNML